MDTKSYLAAVAASTETGSDYAVAKALGVERQYVSHWQRGVHLPDVLSCYAIARRLGIDPARVVADIERERAERQGRTKAAARWREYLESVPGALAAVILSVCAGFQLVPEAHAAPGVCAAPLEVSPVIDRSIHCRGHLIAALGALAACLVTMFTSALRSPRAL